MQQGMGEECRKEYGCQDGGQGENRNVEGQAKLRDFQEPPKAQKKIDQMGHEETDKVSGHSPLGQKQTSMETAKPMWTMY